jgi:hypothetical protein
LVEGVFSAVNDESVSFGSAVNCLEGVVLRKFKVEIEVKVGFFGSPLGGHKTRTLRKIGGKGMSVLGYRSRIEEEERTGTGPAVCWGF